MTYKASDSAPPRLAAYRLGLAAGAVAFALSVPCAAQDDELARLREEAAALRQSLDRLDARIRALERGDPSARKDAAPPATPGPLRSIDAPASIKRGWSRIVPGLPEDQVEALVGKPDKVLHIDNALVWYYVYPELGRASVFFNASGRVTSKQAPGAGW